MFALDYVHENQLLASLPDEELQLLSPHLDWVDLPLGKVIHESGMQRKFVYFPTSAIVSLLYTTEGGASSEIAVVGREGAVGICVFLGGASMPIRDEVCSAGSGYRLRADAVNAAFERSGRVQYLMLCYTQALLTQISHTAMCNRYHSVDQLLCRWLLQSLDRQHGNELLMTQELIANMLGVRREGVTEAALRLQAAGIIHYARGHIWVLDRAGLEAHACDCYRVVKREYDRLLPAVQAA
ncbi:Crp/Fnr family transcriptional regulator [Methyloversatilis sp. XJ19-49]|uniref:Crp/Fnr family transcriptional regulator n=1 Tax=Methyloversatilis sp. XJ19-49 TaxID=2963429 RepID=UPI00211C81FE|nr:Crp/Fnr family transcriptional regulator [Methyloversatilis sp. XJ19-49]MCQ9377546.1 Crp/Fnr family transcriptional regulator [Methyloversatilis sp. XJ19-49]